MTERIPALIAQADELARGVEALSDAVDRLAVSQRHIRQLVGGIIGTLALVLILGVVVACTAADARQASHRAEQATSAARLTCQSGNEARRVSRQLWTYVLDLSSKNPDRPLTAEQARQVRTFRAYLVTAYADRDCDSDSPTPILSPTPSR